MVDSKELEEMQISLIERYVEEMELWIADKDDSRMKTMLDIREKTDALAFGQQFHMLLEQIRLQKSGIVVPQQSSPSPQNMKIHI